MKTWPETLTVLLYLLSVERTIADPHTLGTVGLDLRIRSDPVIVHLQSMEISEGKSRWGWDLRK